MAKSKKLRFFFLNGSLHKVIHIQRAHDVVTAFDYSDGKTKKYIYTDVRRNMQHAFGLTEIAELFDVTREWLFTRIFTRQDCDVNPQKTYHLVTGETTWRHPWMFSEDDLMEIREMFANSAPGRVPKSGIITNNRTPTADQVRAWIEHDKMVYVKQDGEFVPIWRATEW